MVIPHPSHALVLVGGWDATFFAPLPQHGAAVIVRAGDPVQLGTGGGPSAGLLALEVLPHDLLGRRLGHRPTVWRDPSESDHLRGLAELDLLRVEGLRYAEKPPEPA